MGYSQRRNEIDSAIWWNTGEVAVIPDRKDIKVVPHPDDCFFDLYYAIPWTFRRVSPVEDPADAYHYAELFATPTAAFIGCLERYREHDTLGYAYSSCKRIFA